MSKLVLPAGSVEAKRSPQILTKEKIEERLKKLEAEKANIIGALASYEGAIQDCQHWLKELEGG